MKYELLTEMCKPSKKHKTDAGMDLRSTIEILLTPQMECKIPLGFKLEIRDGYFAMIVPRSGLGVKGLTLMNTVGICDSSYRGEYIAFIKNVSDNNSIKINVGDRICQAIIIPCLLDSWEQVDNLTSSDRGENGFGSSGSK